MGKKLVLILLLIVSTYCQSYEYDLVVIGAGAAGTTAAYQASQLGKKVLLVEKNKAGGGKIWAGDLPFKKLFQNSELLYAMNSLFPLHSLNTSSESTISLSNFQDIKTMQDVLHENLLKKISDKSIALLTGQPFFIDRHSIMLNNKKITSDFFIIATGSHSFIPDIKNIENVNYLTRETFFLQSELPESIIIVGGGPLGVEIASSLSKLGIQVDIVMRHGMLLPTYDFEMVECLTQSLASRGVRIHLATHTDRVEELPNGNIVLTCQDRAGGKYTIQADSLFIASGSEPNVDDLNLNTISVKYLSTGIATRKTMQTSVDNIYACGDVVGIIVQARVAYYHAKIAIHNMFHPHKKTKKIANYTHMAKIVYTGPQFASAGLTEQEARKLYGENIVLYKVNYADIDKAYVDQDLLGKAKFICDKNGVLVGAHIFGKDAGVLIDTLSIGSQFSDIFLEKSLTARMSPSYFEVLEKASQEAYASLKIDQGAFKDLFNAYFYQNIKKMRTALHSVFSL